MQVDKIPFFSTIAIILRKKPDSNKSIIFVLQLNGKNIENFHVMVRN